MQNVTNEGEKLSGAARTVRDAWAELFGLGIDPEAEATQRQKAGQPHLRLPHLSVPQQRLFATLRYALARAIDAGHGGIDASNAALQHFADRSVPLADGALYGDAAIRNIKSDWKQAITAERTNGHFAHQGTAFHITFPDRSLRIAVTTIAGVDVTAPLQTLSAVLEMTEPMGTPLDAERERKIALLAGEFQDPVVRDRVRRGWRTKSATELDDVAADLVETKANMRKAPKRWFRRYQGILVVILAGACVLGIAETLRVHGLWKTVQPGHLTTTFETTPHKALTAPGLGREARALDDPVAGLTIRSDPTPNGVQITVDSSRYIEQHLLEHAGHRHGAEDIGVFIRFSPANAPTESLRMRYRVHNVGGWTFPQIYATTTASKKHVLMIALPFHLPPDEAVRSRCTITLPDGTTAQTNPDAIPLGTMVFLSRESFHLPTGEIVLKANIEHPIFGPLIVTQSSRLNPDGRLELIEVRWEYTPALTASGRIYRGFL